MTLCCQVYSWGKMGLVMYISELKMKGEKKKNDFLMMEE